MKRMLKRLCCLMLAVSLLPATGLLAAAEEETARWLRADSQADPNEEERVNLLLIGQDQRKGEAGRRSDSMILCSFFPGEKKLVLTSILRDLYVKIPGYGYDRINAAYAMGGAPLLRDTLRENFHIPVDGTVEVDFEKFPQIIDTLGGVKLTLREDEARELTRQFPDTPVGAGLQTLSGRQTLAYARIRSLDPDGDFSRTGRQRKVLEALAEQYRNLTFGELVKLLKALLPAVTTDLNGFQVLTYGRLFLPMLKKLQVENRKIPEPDCCRDETVGGKAVLQPDLEKIRKRNGDILDS